MLEFGKVAPVWIPFQEKISAAFESERHLPLKLLVGCLVGLAVGANLLILWLTSPNAQDSPPGFHLWLFVGSVTLTVLLVVVLMVKDVIKKRADGGYPVNPIFRLLFISGYVSLVVWIVLAFVGSFVFVIWSV